MPGDRSSAEVNDIQQELMALGFEKLYARNRTFEAYLRGEYDFVADMAEDLKVKEPVYSYEIKQDIEITKGKLHQDEIIHVEPHSPLKRAEVKSDDFEDVAANWLVMADPNGVTDDGVRFNQACKSFAPVWTVFREYAIPTRRKDEKDADYNKRVDEYKRGWFGFALEMDPVETTSFADERRRITMAARKFRKPYIEVARDYGDYDRGKERSKDEESDLMLQICREQFGWARGAEILSQTGPGWANKMIEGVVVDDGVWITHHLDQLPDDKGHTLRQVDKAYRNPFGRVSLSIVSGMYNPGEPLERRYEPLHVALIQAYRNRDLWRSRIASALASRTEHEALSLDAKLLEVWAAIPDTERPKLMRKDPETGKLIVLGTPITFAIELIELYQYMLENAEAEVARLRPNRIFAGEEVGKVLSGWTASAVLKAVGEEREWLKSAVESRTAWKINQIEMFEHAYTPSINDHYRSGSKKKDEDKDKPIYVRSMAILRPEREVAAGKEITLLPADVDFEKTITVEQVDNSVAAMAARGQEADRKFDRVPKAITKLQWLEEQGHSNPTAQDKQLEAEEQYQKLGPRFDLAGQAHAVNFGAIFLGLPGEDVMMTEERRQYLTGLLGTGQQVPAQMIAGNGGASGGQQMDEPYVAAAEGESVVAGTA